MATMGRPRAMSDVQRGQVCALMSVGAGVATAADYVGCSPSTVRREALRNREFYEQARNADLKFQLTPLQCLQKAAATNWRAAAWVVERTQPGRFGRPCKPQPKLQEMLSAAMEELFEAIRHEIKDQRLCNRIAVIINTIVGKEQRDKWAEKHHRRDPERAERLLDEMERARSAPAGRASTEPSCFEDDEGCNDEGSDDEYCNNEYGDGDHFDEDQDYMTDEEWRKYGPGSNYGAQSPHADQPVGRPSNPHETSAGIDLELKRYLDDDLDPSEANRRVCANRDALSEASPLHRTDSPRKPAPLSDRNRERARNTDPLNPILLGELRGDVSGDAASESTAAGGAMSSGAPINPNLSANSAPQRAPEDGTQNRPRAESKPSASMTGDDQPESNNPSPQPTAEPGQPSFDKLGKLAQKSPADQEREHPYPTENPSKTAPPPPT